MPCLRAVWCGCRRSHAPAAQPRTAPAGADLTGANLYGAYAKDAIFKDANMRLTVLESVDFENAGVRWPTQQPPAALLAAWLHAKLILRGPEHDERPVCVGLHC